jgi:hypothetical protein
VLCKWVCALNQRCSARRAGFGQILRIPENRSRSLLCRQGSFSSFGYQAPFFLGQGRVKVQHKRIGISAKLRDDERHSLGHQAGHKGHVARQAVELGNNYAALRSLCRGQRCGQLRAPIQGVRALPAFGFDKLGGNSEAFASGKMIDR